VFISTSQDMLSDNVGHPVLTEDPITFGCMRLIDMGVTRLSSSFGT